MDDRYPSWLSGVLLFIAIAGFLSNILVCVTIFKSRCLHDTTNYLILNLAISDSLCCFMFGLEMFMDLLSYPNDETAGLAERIYCRLIHGNYMFQSFAYISAYNLVLISFERYISLVLPLRYFQLCTRAKIGLSVFVAWLLGFCTYSVHLIGVGYYPTRETFVKRCRLEHAWEWHFVPLGVGFILPLLSMVWAYFHIFKALRPRTEEGQTISIRAQESREATKRVIHLMFIVFITYIVLYIPTQPAYMVLVTINLGYFEFTVQGVILVDLLTKLPVLLNSCANPLIYAFRYKKIRRAFSRIACGQCASTVSPDSTLNIQVQQVSSTL